MNLRVFYLLAFASTIALCAGACSLFSPRDRPLDIEADMPRVTLVIDSVQEAIDKTAGMGWDETKSQTTQDGYCAEDMKKGAETCTTLYDEARKQCRAESGPTAGAVCSDFLRNATAKCAAASKKPNSCELAEAYAPLQIKSAKFNFSAASGVNAQGKLELKLISAQAARKSGRSSSFEIVMVPRARVKMRDGTDMAAAPASRDLSENLVNALKVALHAANRCSSPDDEKCPMINAPQLALQKGTYSIDIDYEQSSSAGIVWTVGPAKLSAGGGRERKLGNTLVIELSR